MIRRATLEDAPQLKTLDEKVILDVGRVADLEYAARMQAHGFIVPVEDLPITERIVSSHLVLVEVTSDQIVGYIDINREVYFPEDSAGALWASPRLKHLYYHDDASIVLHHIVAAPAGKGTPAGYWTAPLKIVSAEGYKDIFSIVTLAPLTNCASLIWHTKNGFERACVTLPHELFGLPQYQSVLFHRSL